MIKCLECGKMVSRIQWTHLRYKCTGRFKTCNEYVTFYPGAKILDESLAKKTSLTLENMVSKYGDEEGKKRWDSYREKQAYSNSFDYKSKKYGWSKEKFDEYNSSRAVTLEKCIQRYGEKEGLMKWHSYCERQAYTNTKEYFVIKYGKEDGIKKFIEYNWQKGKSKSATYYSDLFGISLDEASQLIINRQNFNYGSEIEREFTTLLEQKIGTLEHTSFRKPYGKWSNELSSYVVYDIKHGDCVIEFNGDYWHGNPKLYEGADLIRGKPAKEIWNRDRIKLETAIQCGLRVLVIWESEFKKDKTLTIERVIKWMLSGQK